MGWPTNYSGPQMDASLEKGRDLKVVDNGWIKLDSSVDNPINLNSLKNPGNYSVFYWVNGPALNEASVSPINISIVSINEKIYQFITAGGYTYSRSENSDKTAFGNWTIDHTAGALKPGVSAPASPVNGKTMWMDTSDPNSPILKLYENDEWKEVIPAGIMQSAVYDPQGKRTDIFKYIEDSFAAAIGKLESGDTLDFKDHINDNTIHASKENKNTWDTLPTTDTLTEKVSQIKSDIESEVVSKITPNADTFEELDQGIDLVNASYDLHIADTASHPSIEKRTAWDNKAESGHKHHLDDKVSVSPSHVSGNIPDEKIPYDVKERIYAVASEDELATKTKNPIHNGDLFYIEKPDGITWYFVVDDSYLGTESALTDAFKKFESKQNIVWLNVLNKPTTIEGYGITDAASKADVEKIESQIDYIEGVIPENPAAVVASVADAQTNYNKSQEEITQLKTTVNLLDKVIGLYNEIAQ